MEQLKFDLPDPVQADIAVNKAAGTPQEYAMRLVAAQARETLDDLVAEMTKLVADWTEKADNHYAISEAATDDDTKGRNLAISAGFRNRVHDGQKLLDRISRIQKPEIDFEFLAEASPSEKHLRMRGRRGPLLERAMPRLVKSAGQFPDLLTLLGSIGFLLEDVEDRAELTARIEIRLLHFAAFGNLQSGALPLADTMNKIIRAAISRKRLTDKPDELTLIAGVIDSLVALGRLPGKTEDA